MSIIMMEVLQSVVNGGDVYGDLGMLLLIVVMIMVM